MKMDSRFISRVFVLLIFSTLLFNGLTYLPVYGARNCFTPNVMAPLWVENWSDFENQLAIAKSMGVSAVSVDVWWGVVEKGQDQRFDWSYYDTIFAKIKEKGLKIVPIMSFHQCGGNPGDNYTFKVPSWIWSRYVGSVINGIRVDKDGLKYKSETGKLIDEAVSLWGDEVVKEQYIEFMDAFEQHFAGYANDFLELNISCGPAGELRYPSYNQPVDGWRYPHRGYLQAYSKLAVKDFQDSIISKYGSLTGVNAAWGTNLSSETEISPPMGSQGERDWFYNNRDYFNNQYGRDLTDWYNRALVEHGRNIVEAGLQAFDNQLADIDFGVKIPGVHWLTKQTSDYPAHRAAEMTAGLISSDISERNGYGYKPIASMLKSVENRSGRKIILHFTCLEMKNYSQGPHSLTEDLVQWVGYAAAKEGLAIKGENALAGLEHQYDEYWKNIRQALNLKYGNDPVYTGVTILRIHNVAHGNAKSHYEGLIRDFVKCWKQVYFRGTPNSFDNSRQMQEVSDGIWRIIVDFSSGSNERFKFDIFGDWSLNYGDNDLDGYIDQGGEDIIITKGAGNYEITLDEKNMQYSIVKKTTVGSADVKKTTVGSADVKKTIVGSAEIAYVISGEEETQLEDLSVTLEKDGILVGTENIGGATSFHSDLSVGNYTVSLDQTRMGFNYTGQVSFTINSEELLNTQMNVTKKKIDDQKEDYKYVYKQVYFRGTPNKWQTFEMDLIDDYTWEITVSFGNAINERFKFDIYGDWSLNFGDNNPSDSKTNQGGRDISITEGSGEYAITFNDSTKTYSIEKKGGTKFKSTYERVYFRGTPNAWEISSMDLISDYTWEITVPFTDASDERFKFDIYGDWSLNFGDNNQDGFADQGGKDIPITQKAGKYTITFYDNTKGYEIRKNNFFVSLLEGLFGGN